MNKIAVLGGGVVAMLTAILLKKNRKDVMLWRSSGQKLEGDNKRVFALNRASITFLKVHGILSYLPEQAMQPIAHMRVWDGLGHAFMEFNAQDVHQSELARIVEEPALWEACYQILSELKIPVYESHASFSCVQEKEEWIFSLEAGRCIKADFLCVADGARSPVREYLQVPCEKGSYGQKGIVAHIQVTKPHQAQALQIFGAHGPLAFLPLSSPYHYSMVWSLDDALANHYLELDEQALCQKLNTYWDGYVGRVVAVKGIQSFPLHYLHVNQYYGRNWMLLGDAAHHFHPLAGLGLNAGIADVICLERLLKSQALDERLLSVFQRERRAKIMPLIYGMLIIKNCFGNTDGFWVKLRSLGMDWLNHQSLIKKMMMNMVQDA